MIFQTLSIVSPSGSRIRSGRKTLEVRRWAPEGLPLRNLLIVQNDVILNEEVAEDAAGRVVAIVDVVSVRPWTNDDLEKSAATEFEEGWLAWELENIRPAAYNRYVPAKRGVYEVEINPKFLLLPDGSGWETEEERAEPGV